MKMKPGKMKLFLPGLGGAKLFYCKMPASSFSRLAAVFFLLLSVTIMGSAQSDLQSRIDTIEPGKINVNKMKALFGAADTKIKVYSYLTPGQPEIGQKKVYNFLRLGEEGAGEGALITNLYKFEYKKLGLAFYFFDRQNELYSFTVTNPKILLFGIKVGDKLRGIEKLLGKVGQWTTTGGSDYWNLDFKEAGVRFRFLRNKKKPKYPMKLVSSKVVLEIEKYDKNIIFA